MTDKTIQDHKSAERKNSKDLSIHDRCRSVGSLSRKATMHLWNGGLKSLDERASVISSIASELRKSCDEFAQLMTDEVGKLLRDSLSEIELCAAICDYTAKNGPDFLADEQRDVPNGRGLVTYAPLGVIYGIQPWNFPCYQAVRYSISCLMAGNGVLLKHSENCTGSGLMLRDIFERAGLPRRSCSACC